VARGANWKASDRKLDELQRLLAERTEQLSKPQLEPLQERLDEMHARLEDLPLA
jgi:hypothetical protein